MKKSNFRPLGRTMLKATVLFLIVILSFSSCKQGSDKDSNPIASAKATASTSGAQPLPGGKKYFSNCIGRFASSGATWVRMVNWTFFESTGTVNGSFWQWDSTQEKGKTALNSHSDTWQGSPVKTCSTYTPTGWIVPSGHSVSISGTYTYNTTTKTLVINWSIGTTETWTVTNPIATIARISFVSCTGAGYGITHGAGYGSNRAFYASGGVATANYHYKTVANIPKVLYSGKRVMHNTSTSEVIWYPANATSGAWEAHTLPLNLSTLSSGGTSLHYYTTGSAGCAQSTFPGTVTHLASNNNSRSMVYNHWKACLGVQDGTWPCYNLNLHPYAFQQILDDNGDMKGFVGIEQQNQSDKTGFQYQLVEYTVIP